MGEETDRPRHAASGAAVTYGLSDWTQRMNLSAVPPHEADLRPAVDAERASSGR
jgi:hypothetical protein